MASRRIRTCQGRSTRLAKLRQVDVLDAQGAAVAEAIRQIGITEVSYYKWQQEYGVQKLDQVKPLKELELENAGSGRRSRTLPWTSLS
jgi:transposase-like protein